MTSVVQGYKPYGRGMIVDLDVGNDPDDMV
jgi:hypothetical protein